MIYDKIGGYKQKNKKSAFLFGFVFDLYYLCSVNIEERNKYESNNVNGQKGQYLNLTNAIKGRLSTDAIKGALPQGEGLFFISTSPVLSC